MSVTVNDLNNCSICRDPVDQYNIFWGFKGEIKATQKTIDEDLICLHANHLACYKSWTKTTNTCPVCRAELSGIVGQYKGQKKLVRCKKRNRLKRIIYDQFYLEPGAQEIRRPGHLRSRMDPDLPGFVVRDHIPPEYDDIPTIDPANILHTRRRN
jgi:hypothetical protein